MFYEDTPTASAFFIGKSTIYLSLNCFHQAVPVTNEGYSFFLEKVQFFGSGCADVANFF